MIRRHIPILLATAALVSLTASWAGAQAELAAPRDHSFPKVGKYEVLCADFHMHTINSDGSLTTRERVEESYSFGYDVIAITDHRTAKGYRIARHVGRRLGLVVLSGIETGVKGNEHMNAIGFSSLYEPTNSHDWSETPNGNTVYYRDELKEIADCGGFVIYNHPHVGFREPVEWGVREGMIEGIEVKNDVVGKGWNTIEWNGIHCYPNAFEYGLKHNLTLFANTDVHGRRRQNPAVTLVLSEARTPEAVMEALRARRTAAWFDEAVWGREKLLTDLMLASVKTFRSTDELGKPCLRIENRSPLALKAVIPGTIEQAVEIAPYGETRVPYEASDGKVRVKWMNVWTSPTENLLTTHPCPEDE